MCQFKIRWEKVYVAAMLSMQGAKRVLDYEKIAKTIMLLLIIIIINRKSKRERRRRKENMYIIFYTK